MQLSDYAFQSQSRILAIMTIVKTYVCFRDGIGNVAIIGAVKDNRRVVIDRASAGSNSTTGLSNEESLATLIRPANPLANVGASTIALSPEIYFPGSSSAESTGSCKRSLDADNGHGEFVSPAEEMIRSMSCRKN